MAISSVWSQGYVTDTLYTDNVFREQGPVWINYVAAQGGCVPRNLDQPFAYLELGCGLGHSITMFAAAHPEGRFVGVDFNPAHIDHAQRRARELGLDNLTFVEASFQDLAADAAGIGMARGFGNFEFIAFHGIYSWISVEARLAMQRLIFDRLKPGGLVYNSYNCMPGWAAEAPLQRLASELAKLGSGDSTKRARAAFDRIGEMAKTKGGYFGATTQLARVLPNLAKKPGNYLAHEYLNGDWNAFYATDVAAEMANAKLDFVGSATLIENHEDLVLVDEARKIVAAEQDPMLGMLLKDFLCNQRFRRDVYVRGHAHLGQRETRANLARQPLVAPKSLADLKPSIKVPRGNVNFEIAEFDTLKEVLSAFAGSEREFAEAFQKRGGKAQDFTRLLAILTATGNLTPAAKAFRAASLVKSGGAKSRDGEGAVPRQRVAHKAAAIMLQKAMERSSAAVLPSPVTGNSFAVAASDVLALQECLAGNITPSGLAEKLKLSMAQRGIRVAEAGKAITEPAAVAARLKSQAETFLGETLPLLRRLGLVESA
jgi:SAM-dependent methyltransferase